MSGRRRWADSVSAELVDGFHQVEARLARSGLRIEVLQASWREWPGGHRPGLADLLCVNGLLRFLRIRSPGTSRGVLITVRVTPGPDGQPCVDVTGTPVWPRLWICGLFRRSVQISRPLP